jgi:hypothetical protein
MSITVSTVDLNPECEGCQAARRALEMQQHTINKAVQKVKEMSAELEYLQYFHSYVDLGPADADIHIYLEKDYEKETGKKVPKSISWRA